MSAYVIVEVSIADPVAYQDYKLMAENAIAACGGKYLARGGRTDTLEGDWNPERLVILEFLTADQARAWWHSDVYAGAKSLRQRSATTRMIIVEGLQDT